ncbi:hypothetical protein PUN28_020729 [Cardiocondyla obscurior]|uniref:DUF7041 domain-containing protein n=1 Tax=Cardiocondyla obscurior TaxID=286306 RepID=A0AAW2E529_9HYME
MSNPPVLTPQVSPSSTNEQNKSQENTATPLPTKNMAMQSVSGSHVAAADESTDAIKNCKLPPFWKENPELWFFQVESAFQINRVTNDDFKYHMVVSKLDSDSLQEVADIIKSPPRERKYAGLKKAILDRFMDSADRQMRKLLTQLELGDRKPSQLLRRMRSLADNRASEDVLRVKWMDLLPSSAQRLLRFFKTSSLDELAAAADELLEDNTNPTVLAVSSNKVQTETNPVLPACSVDPSIQATLLALQTSVSQLIGLNRDLLNQMKALTTFNRDRRTRERSQSQSRSRPRFREAPSDICRYHQRWGPMALRCIQPCKFVQKASPSTASGN